MRIAGCRCSPAALPPLPAPRASRSGEGESMAGAVLQMMASLAVVLGIIYLLYYVFNRWFKGIGSGEDALRPHQGRRNQISCPEEVANDRRSGGEYLLLGNGSEGVQLIKKLENGDEFARPQCRIASPAVSGGFPEDI